MINSKKICLGTSQFSDTIYGATNKIKKPLNVKKIKELLNFSLKKKISYLDLSLDDQNPTYFNVNKKLKKTRIDMSQFKIILKVKLHKNEDKNKKLIKKIENFLSEFKIKKIYAVLIHNSKDFNRENLHYIQSFFKYLKKRDYSYYKGISIYSIDEFFLLNKIKLEIEVIQLPFNYFDRGFLNKKITKIIKKKKIKVFLRSIFLQGILLEEFKNLNKFFLKWKNFFFNYYECLTKNQISRIQFNINYALNTNPYGLILGITNKKQLSEILKTKRKKNIYFERFKQYIPLDLIKPYKWPKKIYIKKK